MSEPTLYDYAQAAAEALSGVVDDATGIKHQVYEADPNSTPSAFAQLMNLERKIMLLAGSANRGQVAWSGSGLTVVAFGLEYRLGVTAYSFAGEATGLALTANETHYVYLDSAQTLKTQLTTWPSGDHIKLAKVTTNATQVTAITDMRFANHMVGVANAWSAIAATSHVDFDTHDADGIAGLGLSDPDELTLNSSGGLTLTAAQTNIRVDTYADAATDDLQIILTNASMQGRIVILRAAHTDRTVVVKATAINSPHGDFTMDDTDKFIVLFGDDSGGFRELCRNFWSLPQLSEDLDVNEKALSNLAEMMYYVRPKTIWSGSISASGGSFLIIDTEAAAASDDLDTISSGIDGQLCCLVPANTAHVVTVKDGSDNILLTYGDFVMNDSASAIWLRYVSSLTKWVEVSRSFVSLADLAKVSGAPKGIPYSPSLFVSGALSVAVLKPSFRSPIAFDIKKATGDVGTAPSGGACIIDVRVNGLSIFANQSEMINIADGTTNDTSIVLTTPHSVSANDVITLECEAANGAADLSVAIDGYAAPQTPPT